MTRSSTIHWIDSPQALNAMCTEWPSDVTYSVDLEANGLYVYQAQICVIQVGWLHPVEDLWHIALIDTFQLGPSALEQLRVFLGPRGPRKLIHDVAFDAWLLARARIELGNVFDTATTARFLGEPSTGLSALVERYFAHTLSKKLQSHNWGERPLSEEALEYLSSDVIFLADLARELSLKAQEKGILEEIEEETLYRLRKAFREGQEDPPPYARMKIPGPKHQLSTKQLVALRALADEREKQARMRNVPPGTLISNANLFELSSRSHISKETISKRIPSRIAESETFIEQLLLAWQQSTTQTDIPHEERTAYFSVKSISPAQIVRRKACEARLSAWRSKEATTRNVNEQVVLPGHCLNDLVGIQPKSIEELAQIEGLGNKRIQRDGLHILQIFSTPENVPLP